MKKFTKMYKYLILAFCITASIGACRNYYQATQPRNQTLSERAATVDSLRLAQRYFVLRNGSLAYYMSNLKLSEDNKTLNCSLEMLPDNRQFHLKSGRNKNMRYKKNNSDDLLVLNEVHFYIQPDKAAVLGSYTLHLDSIIKIEVIEKDKTATTFSYVFGAIGYTVGALVIAGVIAMATKSSCPFVSSYDGKNFTLQGEIFGGAIYPQLARHDYMPLLMKPFPDGTLQLKISNELKECQYTDMADLWVITHDKDVKIFADEKGSLHSVLNPIFPTIATLNGKKDVTLALLKEGDNAMLYMDDTTDANPVNEVVMKFEKGTTDTKAKLVLSLKNSYFLDLLYGELAKSLGTYYNTYKRNQLKKSAAELLDWTKAQQIPLEVSVKTNNGWKIVTDITTIGPLATRNIVVPIELPETKESFTAIKLSSGFMFWEVDYAALDYSDEKIFSVQKISPSRATDELGKNVLPFLQQEDSNYLRQPDIGNTATIIYSPAPLNDDSKIRTYILHTKGYYEHLWEFKNKPDFAFLKQFKQPNAFPKYGMQKYKKIAADTKLAMAKQDK